MRIHQRIQPRIAERGHRFGSFAVEHRRGAALGLSAPKRGPLQIGFHHSGKVGFQLDTFQCRAGLQLTHHWHCDSPRRGPNPKSDRLLVDQQVEQPLLGFLGEPRVNLLQLNLALEALR